MLIKALDKELLKYFLQYDTVAVIFIGDNNIYLILNPAFSEYLQFISSLVSEESYESPQDSDQ